MKEETCTNCHSRRRRVHRAGYCSKCYYWLRKRKTLQRNLDLLPSRTRSVRMAGISYEIRVADRILQEYAWRESRLNESDVDPLDVEALVYAVAAECRSEVRFALHSWFASQTPESRKCIFMVLLAIVENIPARIPRLSTLRPPKKGTFNDAWMEWTLDFHRR